MLKKRVYYIRSKRTEEYAHFIELSLSNACFIRSLLFYSLAILNQWRNDIFTGISSIVFVFKMFEINLIFFFSVQQDGSMKINFKKVTRIPKCEFCLIICPSKRSATLIRCGFSSNRPASDCVAGFELKSCTDQICARRIRSLDRKSVV